MRGELRRILVAELEETHFLSGGIFFHKSFHPILDEREAIFVVSCSFYVARLRQNFSATLDFLAAAFPFFLCSISIVPASQRMKRAGRARCWTVSNSITFSCWTFNLFSAASTRMFKTASPTPPLKGYYRTPDFVNGPFVALDDIFDLAPLDRFLNFSFPSYGRFREGDPQNGHILGFPNR